MWATKVISPSSCCPPRPTPSARCVTVADASSTINTRSRRSRSSRASKASWSEGGVMKFGASTFIWASPFSNATLDLVDKIAELGFDLIEVCVEDPSTIDTAAIRKRIDNAGIGATVCGAFGPDRDMSADDADTRRNAIAYVKRCADIAAELGADIVVG